MEQGVLYPCFWVLGEKWIIAVFTQNIMFLQPKTITACTLKKPLPLTLFSPRVVPLTGKMNEGDHHCL